MPIKKKLLKSIKVPKGIKKLPVKLAKSQKASKQSKAAAKKQPKLLPKAKMAQLKSEAAKIQSLLAQLNKLEAEQNALKKAMQTEVKKATAKKPPKKNAKSLESSVAKAKSKKNPETSLITPSTKSKGAKIDKPNKKLAASASANKKAKTQSNNKPSKRQIETPMGETLIDQDVAHEENLPVDLDKVTLDETAQEESLVAEHSPDTNKNDDDNFN